MNQLDAFLEDLRRALATMPKAVSDGAIQYYTEYFDDARQAGVPEEEILKKTGSVEQVASAIADDLAITAAEARPSPLRLLRTSRRLLGRNGRQSRSRGLVGAVRAARGTSLAIVSLFPLAAAIIFYLTAFAILAGTAAVAIALALNLSAHPDLLTSDRVAQAGLIAGLAAVGLMLALISYRAGHAFGRLTLGIFRRILDRPRLATTVIEPAVEPTATTPAASETSRHRRRTAWQATFVVLLVVAIAGFTVSAAFDLPQSYFRLWNSQQPAGVQPVVMTVSDGPVRKVSITTLNANIVVQPASSQGIQYRYEQPPYCQMERTISDNAIALNEKSNGRLPLIDLLAAHEGTTTLTVMLPVDAQNLELQVQTNGGSVDIHVPSHKLTVRTGSGTIRLHGREPGDTDVLFSAHGHVEWLEN